MLIVDEIQLLRFQLSKDSVFLLVCIKKLIFRERGQKNKLDWINIIRFLVQLGLVYKLSLFRFFQHTYCILIQMTQSDQRATVLLLYSLPYFSYVQLCHFLGVKVLYQGTLLSFLKIHRRKFT